MDSTVSVSKGCFIFNAPTKIEKRTQKAGPLSFCKDRWYTSYRSLWNYIENKLQKVNSDVYSNMLKDLVDYVEHSQEPSTKGMGVPVATLLTGVNMPDHAALFAQLLEILHNRVTPHVATLHARSCLSIRATIEQIVLQLVSGSENASQDNAQQSMDEESEDDENGLDQVLKKQQCNFTTLEAWYQELMENNLPLKEDPLKQSERETSTQAKNDTNVSPISELKTLKGQSTKRSPTKRSSTTDENDDVTPAVRRKASCGRPIIVIVIPEFEGFNAKVLQTLLAIASSKYPVLPMTFVFGVATAEHVLQCRLSYRVSAKLSIKIFRSQKSITFLDQVLEQVFLTADCPFLLGGKTFKLFCEVFLFFDFSVEAFVQHFKFCLMEHFFGEDSNSLCCPLEQLDEQVALLNKTDFAQIRKLPSILAYEEKCTKTEKEIFTYGTNIAFKKKIQNMMLDLRKNSANFFVMLQVLNVFCSNLPTAPLGKHIRKLYESAVSDAIYDTKEYKECFKMLGLQSRDELVEKLEKAIGILTLANTGDEKPFTTLIARLQELATLLENAGMTVPKSTPKSPTKDDRKLNPSAVVDSAGKKISRSQFLMNMKAGCAKHDQPRSDYEIAREELINYLTVMFPMFLAPLTTLPLHEIVLFDNVSAVKRHIIGSPRAAIHMALDNPHYYLQCKCCILETHSAVQSTLPDLCIAYKLHLECGKLINLYDWLQGFASVVNADRNADSQISPEIQARFASSVSELQLLGFIKTTQKKADHVSRLTHNPR